MTLRSLSKRFRDFLSELLLNRYKRLLRNFFPNPDEFRELLDKNEAVLASYPLLYLVDFRILRVPTRLHLACNQFAYNNIISFLQRAGYRGTHKIEKTGSTIIPTTTQNFWRNNHLIHVRSSQSKLVVLTSPRFSRSVDYFVASGSGYVIAYPQDFSTGPDPVLGYLGERTDAFSFEDKYHMRRFGDTKCLMLPFSNAFSQTVCSYKRFLPVWHEHYSGWPMKGFGLDNALDPFSEEAFEEQQRMFRSTRIFF